MKPRIRLLLTLAVAAVALAALVVAGREGGDGASREARVERITSELRCPTCEGLSVADSPSSTARAIRDDVTRRVAAGESDDAVKQAYVDRYGEWILLRPRAGGLAAAVWALPVVVVVGAGAALWFAVRRWRNEPRLVPSDDDRKLVARALADPIDGAAS